MKVLFVVWELAPFFKMGGLGDIAMSLPGALKKLGLDVRIILPYYKAIKMSRNKKTKIGNLNVFYGEKKFKVEVWEVLHPYTKVPVYFLKNSKYLDKVILQETWGFFDKTVVDLVESDILNWKPDIIHINDHHGALIPLLIKIRKLPIKTFLTIHNLAYQGKTGINVIKKIGIDPKSCRVLDWEIKIRQINFLLEGIIHADVVTTVSPTYAKEILTEQYGYGLNEYLVGMEGKIFGILNGIDESYRSVTHDKAVKYPYYSSEKKTNGKIEHYSWQEGKKLNKLFLQKKLGLKVDEKIPLVSFIGRLDERQKGLDIMHKMLRRAGSKFKFEFVVLGDGDTDWEERFKWFSSFYPKFVSCNFRFDESLAHQIYAASDFMLIPSLYEPCGLIQMIAMLFGTLPVAHKTGGLKDSIKDGYNGFLFSKYDSQALEKKLMEAINIWANDKEHFATMVENALKTDFSWDKSGKEYVLLYQKIMDNSLFDPAFSLTA